MRRFPLLALLIPLSCAAGTATAPAPKQAAVDLGLLEFLADWQAPDGSWVDPMTFARIDPAKVVKPGKPATVPPPAAATAPGVQAR